MEILIGSALGTAGSLVVAWAFHRRSSRALQGKMDRLERLFDVIARVLDDPERTSISRDELGKIIGNTYHLKASAAQVSVGAARPRLIRKAKPRPWWKVWDRN